jgi:hypothetical protein
MNGTPSPPKLKVLPKDKGSASKDKASHRGGGPASSHRGAVPSSHRGDGTGRSTARKGKDGKGKAKKKAAAKLVEATSDEIAASTSLTGISENVDGSAATKLLFFVSYASWPPSSRLHVSYGQAADGSWPQPPPPTLDPSAAVLGPGRDTAEQTRKALPDSELAAMRDGQTLPAAAAAFAEEPIEPMRPALPKQLSIPERMALDDEKHASIMLQKVTRGAQIRRMNTMPASRANAPPAVEPMPSTLPQQLSIPERMALDDEKHASIMLAVGADSSVRVSITLWASPHAQRPAV